jgi:BatD DUF11 like domain
MNLARPIITGLLAAALSLPALGAARAWLDSEEVGPGDSVQLTLEEDSQTNSQPDLTPLRRDFDVLGTSTSRKFQIVNGHTSSATQLIVTLSPKGPGSLRIPSLRWGSDTTPQLSIRVASNSGGATSGATKSGAPRIFLQTDVERSDPYVQAGVPITVRLYTAEPLQQVNLTVPQSPDVLVMQVGNETSTTAEKDDHRYQLITRHYMLFPQRSGVLHLPGPTLDAQVPAVSSGSSPFGADPFQGLFANSPFTGFPGSQKPLRLHGDPIQLNVRPQPAGFTGSWIPAQDAKLSARWAPQNAQVHAGEPVTVDLQLAAMGLTAEQLPDLAAQLHLPDTIKSYPDQPKFQNTIQGNAVLGTRSQSIALIADSAGQVSIPPIKLQWWDTAANRARELGLPGKTLTILPPIGAPGIEPRKRAGPAGLPRPSSSREGTANSSNITRTAIAPGTPVVAQFWRSLALLSGVLWMVTVLVGFAWLLRRSDSKADPTSIAPAPATNELAARTAFLRACGQNDPTAARRHLLEWVATVRGTQPARTGLNDLARRSADPHLALLLRELDRASVTHAEWQGEPLSKALRKLPWKASISNEPANPLKPLYH